MSSHTQPQNVQVAFLTISIYPLAPLPPRPLFLTPVACRPYRATRRTFKPAPGRGSSLASAAAGTVRPRSRSSARPALPAGSRDESPDRDLVSCTASPWLLLFSLVRGRLEELDLDLPSLGQRHPGPVRVLSHQAARRRPVRYENHTAGRLALDAGEGRFAPERSHANRASTRDADVLHVVRVHLHGAHGRL